MELQRFYAGQCFDAYRFLGAHKQDNGVIFRVFAPSAKGVGLLLNHKEIPMEKTLDGNFYQVFVEGAAEGTKYLFRIYTGQGWTDHCDPYGFSMELRPDFRSIVTDLEDFPFHDQEWMANRNDRLQGPCNIYELHAGSWKQQDGKWFTYDQLAEKLIPYLKESGYQYVEFLPLCEYPCDESWGYQNTGYFAPTSRYGSPKQLKRLIDLLHQNQIGVILDFVPAHFAVDTYGLAQFDGTALYEYPHRDVGVSEWGSCNFMHSRGEVRSFLQSAAQYWMEIFHFDGLRMDAISRILYWQGDPARGVNGNGVSFLQTMNRGLKERNPGCMLIAEDSTNFPKVTRKAEEGGLGFDYKWDMGWMHDTLNYFRTPPWERTAAYHKLTFSMMYYWQENYLLPLSHDEVVHGKATILQKMYGEYGGKFPQARGMYLYMMMHPGKKLLFMGNEFGQLREWDEHREQDWMLLDYPIHDGFYQFMRELNRLYLQKQAFWLWDYKEEGFQWLDCHQEERCIYAIRRQGEGSKLVAVFNFGDMPQTYQLTLPEAKGLTLLLHSDWQRFGGQTEEGQKEFPAAFSCELPPYAGLLFEVRED